MYYPFGAFTYYVIRTLIRLTCNSAMLICESSFWNRGLWWKPTSKG